MKIGSSIVWMVYGIGILSLYSYSRLDLCLEISLPALCIYRERIFEWLLGIFFLKKKTFKRLRVLVGMNFLSNTVICSKNHSLFLIFVM